MENITNLKELTTQQLIGLSYEIIRLIKERTSISRGDRVTLKDNLDRLSYGIIEKVELAHCNVRLQDGRLFKCHVNLLTRI